jgi:DNA-binding beta-propeller fold protein YncE
MSTQPPPTPTGTGATVPAFDRGRFAAIIPISNAGNLTVANGRLWVLDAGSVVRMDPATNAAVGRPLRVPADAEAIAIAQGALWVASVAPGDLGAPGKDTVARIDPATNRVVGSPIPIGAHHAGNLAVGAGSVWVTSDYRVDGAAEDTVVVRIDPQTNRAAETIAVGGHPIDVAATRGAVWVSVANPGTVLRIAAR